MDKCPGTAADWARNEADRAREDVKALSEKLDYLAAKLGIKLPEKPKPQFPGHDMASYWEALKKYYLANPEIWRVVDGKMYRVEKGAPPDDR